MPTLRRREDHGFDHLPGAISAWRRGQVLLVTLFFLSLASCEREERQFRESPPTITPPDMVRLGSLQPGTVMIASSADGPYDDNAYAVAQGMRLFGWYNCVGCHAHGGGGMGPPLMDDQWIYGSSAANIYSTIVEGRPNGMPSWGGRIPNMQVWQLVAYVRSLGGLTSPTVVSGRADAMMMYPESQVLRSREEPRQSTTPPASEMP